MHDVRQSWGGWLLTICGNLAIWLGSHGVALVGVVSVLFGMWVQWQLLKLRRVEVQFRLSQPPPRPDTR